LIQKESFRPKLVLMSTPIFKVVSRDLWAPAENDGVFNGAAIDLTDGFIHFSTAGQVVETVSKHFAGRTDLLLVTVDPEKLGDQLKWEISRGGELFPHLYGQLKMSAVCTVEELPIGPDGRHVIPSFKT